jgi:threonine synthase
MKYVSTRGGAEPVDFLSASLMGLASDGGLFVPEAYPRIDRPQVGDTYVQTAARVLQAFAGDALPATTVMELATRAYAPFAHQSVAPLVEMGPCRWMMELHHGPTLAFKDVAMRLIAQLYDHVLEQRGQRMMILCATSGDTGGAAAAAFAGSRRIDLLILHPLGRVSPTQRLFMTATGASNVHNLALEGDFDGTQAILKQILADDAFRIRMSLSAVNSINWTRVAAQSVYFAQAQAQLGATRPIQFVVPTGNFGDALAAYVAHRCGLLHSLDCVVAVNANDAMHRMLSGGALEKGATLPTLSPAMDIQLPSNFERLLFEASGRDGAFVADAYSALARAGSAPLPGTVAAAIGAMGYSSGRVSDAETLVEMQRTRAETGHVVCPHAAVGLAVARRRDPGPGVQVTLATAHAAKFPETVGQALGRAEPLPERVAGLSARGEVYETQPMDVGVVRRRIEQIVAGAA